MERTRIREHARDMEKAIERWRKEHRKLGEVLSLGKES
jgi:nucleosome binding factor SPN SPT16 subunit